ncbi:uncharacterized protein J7T54_002731, partial [Emericellopsis cladophorae]
MEVDNDGTSAPPEEEKKDAAPNEAPQERGFGQPDEASENPGSNANDAEPQFKAEEDDGLFLTEHTGKKAHTGDNSPDELEELGDIGRITSVTSLVDSKLDISIKGPFGKWYAIYRDGPRHAPYYHMGRMADDQFSESGKANVFRLGESGSEPRIRRVIGFVGYKTYHDYLGLLKALAQRHWPAENG